MTGPGWRRRPPVEGEYARAARPLLLVLAFAAAGCSAREPIQVHGEPRVVEESEERLIATAAADDDGSVTLRAWRERERTLEQDFWWIRSATRRSGHPFAVASTDQQASEALAQLAGAAVAIVAWFVYEAVVSVGTAFAVLFRKVDLALNGEEAFPEERWTVRRKEVVRKASYVVIVSRLGVNASVRRVAGPDGAFRLEPAEVETLGGPGALVLVSDGPLRTSITLPP